MPPRPRRRAIPAHEDCHPCSARFHALEQERGGRVAASAANRPPRAAASHPLGFAGSDSRPGRRAIRIAAAAAYWTVSLRLVLPGFFGSVSSSTPSVYLAVAAFSSTSEASVKLRVIAP